MYFESRKYSTADNIADDKGIRSVIDSSLFLKRDAYDNVLVILEFGTLEKL